MTAALIDDYLNQVGQKKVIAPWPIFSGLSTTSPLDLSEAETPDLSIYEYGFLLRITASIEGSHDNCTGTVTVDGEPLSLDGPGIVVSGDPLMAIPTITTTDLDCHLEIIAVDTDGIQIDKASWVNFACRWADAQFSYQDSHGDYVMSNSKIQARELFYVNDYIRKLGDTGDGQMIEKDGTAVDLDGETDYRTYIT